MCDNLTLSYHLLAICNGHASTLLHALISIASPSHCASKSLFSIQGARCPLPGQDVLDIFCPLHTAHSRPYRDLIVAGQNPCVLRLSPIYSRSRPTLGGAHVVFPRVVFFPKAALERLINTCLDCFILPRTSIAIAMELSSTCLPPILRRDIRAQVSAFPRHAVQIHHLPH